MLSPRVTSTLLVFLFLIMIAAIIALNVLKRTA